MTQVTEALPEPARLEAVRRTTLLDAPPDEAFDRLTRLAARLLGTSVALISLVEKDRQFFVSATGLSEPLASTRTTPISYSFCRHVVDSKARLVVEDARHHQLVRTNPAVREYGWVAYAGVPLTDRSGHVLGALSVIDGMPRLFSERDLDLLEDLAAWAVTEIELRAAASAPAAPVSAPSPAPAPESAPDPVFEESGVPMAILSLDGRCTRVNKAFADLLGAGDPTGRLIDDLTDPGDRPAHQEAMRLLLAGECRSYTAEKRMLGEAGVISVLATVTHVTPAAPEPGYFILALQDVSGRARLEADVRDGEERNRLAADNIHDVIWDWDLLTDRIVWEGGSRGFFGYGPQDPGPTAAWWYERLHPDERERVVGTLHEAVARRESVWADEHRFRCADGSWAHVEVRGSIVRDMAGDAVRMVGATLDVTARKRAELVLRCQSELLRDIAGGTDLQEILRKIVGFAEAYGGRVAAVHLLAEDGTALRLAAGPNLPPEFAAAVESVTLGDESGPWTSAVQRREAMLATDLAPELPAAWIAPLLAADGTVLGTFALFNSEPDAPDTDDARVVRIATDLARLAIERERSRVTLRKNEEDLRQAQKMEAVGQLAGGVAHDFNNLLTGILSYSDLILQELHQGDPVRSDVEQIRHAGHRAAALTRQLLAFSRRQVLQPKVVSPNTVVSDLESMLRRLLGASIALDVSLDPGLWYVMADPAQLEQMIVKLVVNARDAMPDGRTRHHHDRQLWCRSREPRAGRRCPAGAYVTLSVTDTGVGMDVAAQARIFEPATLGISSINSAVEQSGGHITVQSAPGRGATFTVYLPRHADSAGPVTGALDRRNLPSGSETLLLVEDESSVRSSARRLLESHGYRVVEARHGVEALRVAEEPGHRFDLVLTDVVMPEMGGKELVERLRTRYPGLKVLFMSGYTERSVSVDGAMPPGTGFVEKPFTVEQLLRRLRKILDS